MQSKFATAVRVQWLSAVTEKDLLQNKWKMEYRQAKGLLETAMQEQHVTSDAGWRKMPVQFKSLC